MAFDLSDYKDVAERIADLKAKHPEASLRPANPDEPFRIVTIGDKTFLAYTAACYRSPEDQAPGIGVAWEPFPGQSNYTRNSELQNAETSAWGRAIVAALASESRQVASRNEVANRRADRTQPAFGKAQAKARLLQLVGPDDAKTAWQWGSFDERESYTPEAVEDLAKRWNERPMEEAS